jgi:hypothetical protein
LGDPDIFSKLDKIDKAISLELDNRRYHFAHVELYNGIIVNQQEKNEYIYKF